MFKLKTCMLRNWYGKLQIKYAMLQFEEIMQKEKTA